MQQDGQTSYIWIADQATNLARKVTVVTGSRGSRNMIEITSGLTETSKLIANPGIDMRDQERIQISGEQPAPVDITPDPRQP